MQRQYTDTRRNVGVWSAMITALGWGSRLFHSGQRSHTTRDGWSQHSQCSSATQRRVRKEQKLARRMQRQHDPYFRAART